MFQWERRGLVSNWGKVDVTLSYKEIRDLYRSPDIIGTVKSINLRRTGHVISMKKCGMHTEFWY
jgi:hypothetical protein